MYEDILTRKEVAELLRLHIRTVQRMEKQGRLTSFKISGAVRFKRSDIEKRIAETSGFYAAV